MAYGNGVWVAAGVFKLTTSTDGRRWTERPRDHCFESITFGQGRFVGTCGGEIYTSTDGIKWTPPKRPDIGGHCYVVVSVFVVRLFAKLGVRSRVEAVTVGIERRLLRAE